MSEKPIPETLLSSEEFQLATAGAGISMQKCQACAAARDEMGVRSATTKSISFLDRAIEMIEERLDEIDKEVIDEELNSKGGPE